MGTLLKNGYLKTTIKGKQWLLHRLAWFLHTGETPEIVDHVNGIKTDNRLVNLRATDKRGNGENRRGPTRANKTGFLGVTKVNNRYCASIKISGKKQHLGYYATPEEAHAVYLRAKRKHHRFNTL